MRLTNALAMRICLVSGIGPTQAQMGLGDARRGQELSQRVCSGCHSVSPGSAGTVNADVPTFAAIAAARIPRPSVLQVASCSAIPPMPSVQLHGGGNALAYILSLRPQR